MFSQYASCQQQVILHDSIMCWWWPPFAPFLTLLVGRQEGHAACKNWVLGCCQWPYALPATQPTESKHWRQQRCHCYYYTCLTASVVCRIYFLHASLVQQHLSEFAVRRVFVAISNARLALLVKDIELTWTNLVAIFAGIPGMVSRFAVSCRTLWSLLSCAYVAIVLSSTVSCHVRYT